MVRKVYLYFLKNLNIIIQPRNSEETTSVIILLIIIIINIFQTTSTEKTTESTTTKNSSPTISSNTSSSTNSPTTSQKHTEDVSTIQQSASTLVTGSEYENIVQQLCDMGFAKEDAVKALRAAYNNPDRAVEYLMNVNKFLLIKNKF